MVLSKSRSNGNSGNANTKRKRDLEAHHSDQVDESSPEPAKSRKTVRWGSGVEAQGEEGEDDYEEETVITDKICLAASCQFGRIGCAYFDPVKSVIFVFEDTRENQHFDLTRTLLEQVSPDIVLTSSKADDDFTDKLSDHMDASGGTLQIRPHKDFTATKGRHHVLSLRLLSELPADLEDRPSDLESNSEPRNAYDFMRRRKEISGDPDMQRWNAAVRLANFAAVEEAPLCLSSIGALLDYLARLRAVGNLDDDGVGGLEVREIQILALTDCMQINADALFSLQIFEDESHASVHSDKTKEGHSIYGILNNTKTSLGRYLLRDWLLRPSSSMAVITARHNAVACFLRPDNMDTTNTMHTHLNGIKNVPRILGIMKAGKATTNDWKGLVKFTFHSLLLRDSLMELSNGNGVEVVQKLLKALDGTTFRDVGNSVNAVIDWEESENAGRVCVKPRVDEELDRMKHVYHGIDSVLSKVAQQISTSVPPDYATSLNVVYFPQLGFLVCVPMLEEWSSDEGIKVLDGWSFQFSSDSHVYFKSQEMHDMDAHIGDLHPCIVDREIEIVQSLQERIQVYEKMISHVCDVCAELDCLLSFAEAARVYNYRQPTMTEDNIINIKQGRHPLQELVVDTFVANDAYVVGGARQDDADVHHRDKDDDDAESAALEEVANNIVVCTGANACGKSVYLKQVALIQYMAQIGSFVPAEAATLGIVDKIFTRIQTRESVSKVQSAFMIDLNQVSLALRNCTARSLILLDEFGKGTMSTDGAGLFCGTLKHLISRGSDCPKVLAATHFHDIFTEDLLDPHSSPITFLHMEVLFATDRGQVLDTSSATMGRSGSLDDDTDVTEERSMLNPQEKITYLYRVARGLSLDSQAAICAEICGIPHKLAQRAQYVSRLLSMHELGQILDEEMSSEERKELQDAEEVCRKFLAWDLVGGDEDRNPMQELKKILRKCSEE